MPFRALNEGDIAPTMTPEAAAYVRENYLKKYGPSRLFDPPLTRGHYGIAPVQWQVRTGVVQAVDPRTVASSTLNASNEPEIRSSPLSCRCPRVHHIPQSFCGHRPSRDLRPRGLSHFQAPLGNLERNRSEFAERSCGRFRWGPILSWRSGDTRTLFTFNIARPTGHRRRDHFHRSHPGSPVPGLRQEER